MCYMKKSAYRQIFLLKNLWILNREEASVHYISVVSI